MIEISVQADARRTRPTFRVVESARQSTNLSWLLKLRWGAVASEGALILIVDRTTVPLPLVPLFVVLGVVVVSNLLLTAHHRKTGEASDRLLAAVLAFDVIALTTMLAFTGGPLNPFSSLYLVNIALAAVVLSGRFIWAIVGLSAVGYAALFAQSWMSGEFFGPDHARHMQIHLKGMWLAFMVAALFIGTFVHRIQRALADRERELARVRAQQARNEKLGALATLAAGAAHELSTPLSTIAVVARELATHLERAGADDGAIEDARLIREEVSRCRAVLDQLAADAGGTVGDEPRLIEVPALLDLARDGLSDRPKIESHLAPEVEGRRVRVPPRALALALRSVLKNAQDASAAERTVTVRASVREGALAFEIADRGTGIDPETLSRVGDPFFTTKEPGRGMGLGMFLTRSVLEQLGGEVRIDSIAGQGTTVVLALPQEVLAT